MSSIVIPFGHLILTKSNDSTLFRDPGFIILFVACALATFPLFVPPFFLPIYARGIGLSSSTGAALVSGFNFSSAVGRVLCGTLCDSAGPINTLLLSLLLSAVSMLAVWPVSTSIGPLVVFTVINGAANGGFFSTVPTVAGNTFGSARVSVVMGMIVTGWVGGYLMVSTDQQFVSFLFIILTRYRVPLLQVISSSLTEARAGAWRPFDLPSITQVP